MESNGVQPNDVDFLNCRPAITLSPSDVKEYESRVGSVCVEYFGGIHLPRIMITISEIELQIAEHGGLVIKHPTKDSCIFFGPWEYGEYISDMDCCTVTKFTRTELEAGKTIRYDQDDGHDIVFKMS